jgi:hypothetical protein
MNKQKENFGLVGRTWIKKVTEQNPEGVLVDYIEKNILSDGSAPNTIFPGVSTETTSPTGLKSFLAQCMAATTDRALNNLFTAAVINDSEDTKDGIAVLADLASYNSAPGLAFTMITTTMNTTSSFARKWKGNITISGSPQSFSAAAIGWNWSGAPNSFATTYATQSFTTVTLGVGESLVIEWEIAIN